MRLLQPPACSSTCTLHTVIEGHWPLRCYPYRCPRCGQCFVCRHWLIGYRWWVCPLTHFGFVRTHFGPGAPVIGYPQDSR